jgi:hypothetical protein
MTNVLGFIGMGLVMGSFLTKDIKTLRFVNALGCIVFLAHGFIINDPATIATNGALLTINTIRLAA